MSEQAKSKRGRPFYSEADKELAKQKKRDRGAFAKRFFGQILQQEGGITQAELEERFDLERDSVSAAMRGVKRLDPRFIGKIVIRHVCGSTKLSPEQKTLVARMPLEFSLEELMTSEARRYEVQSELRQLDTEEKLTRLRSKIRDIENEIHEVEISALQQQIVATEEILQRLNDLNYKKTGCFLTGSSEDAQRNNNHDQL